MRKVKNCRIKRESKVKPREAMMNLKPCLKMAPILTQIVYTLHFSECILFSPLSALLIVHIHSSLSLSSSSSIHTWYCPLGYTLVYQKWIQYYSITMKKRRQCLFHKKAYKKWSCSFSFWPASFPRPLSNQYNFNLTFMVNKMGCFKKHVKLNVVKKREDKMKKKTHHSKVITPDP